MPRHVDLRVFSVAGAAGATHALPAPLTRVALDADTSLASGGTKGTWIVD